MAEPGALKAQPEVGLVWHAQSDLGWGLAMGAALAAGISVGYFLQRNRRQRFEEALQKRLEFEKLVSELSIYFINMPAETVDDGVEQALTRVQQAMGLDHCLIFDLRPGTDRLRITHQSAPKAEEPPQREPSDTLPSLPWLTEQLRATKAVKLESPTDLPATATEEKGLFQERQLKSWLAIPLRTTEESICGICYFTTEQKQTWTQEQASSLQLIGDVLLSSLCAKRAEISLRLTETSMNLAAESALLGFWRWYPDENRSWLSEQARKIYGFEPETRGTHADYLKRIHPEDRAAALERFKQGIKTEQAFEHEYRLVFPNNEIRWVVVRARLVRKPDGKLQEIVGVSIDVTRSREQDLQMRQQHEELARMGRVAVMGEMTASLAHELNQPLTAIVSNASAARRFMAQGSTDQELMAELLQDISTAGQRAGEIIRSIRGMVRPGGVGRESLDLNEVVRQVLRLMRTDFLARESSVETELAHGLPLVDAVSVQVQQVLMNLVMNGIEAMQHLSPNQRRLLITTGVDAAGKVAVTVRDHGTGLPENVPPTRLFEQFYSTKRDGMGMGLAIARSIVEAHGGKLKGENEPDGGARFTFTLPVRKSPPVPVDGQP